MIGFLVVSDGLCVSYVFFKERFALKVIVFLCRWSEGAGLQTLSEGVKALPRSVFLGTATHHVLNDPF